MEPVALVIAAVIGLGLGLAGYLRGRSELSRVDRDLEYERRIRALGAEIERLADENDRITTGDDLRELADHWREQSEISERLLELCRRRSRVYTEPELDERERAVMERTWELRERERAEQGE